MRILALVIALQLTGQGIAAAQERASPVGDLLRRSRDALNNLSYGQADSLARMVLALGDRVSAVQRREALEIQAAALYPDPEGGGEQYPDRSLALLRQIVRHDSDARVRSELSWRGLDSLMAIARRTAFGARVQPGTEHVLVGTDGTSGIEVSATRPARFALTLVPASGGAAVEMDAAGPADRASLRVRAFHAGRSVLATGAYQLVVRVVDDARPDTITFRYQARVDAPPLELVPVPTALDSSQLRPERAGRARVLGVMAGVVMAGALVAGNGGLAPPAGTSTGSGAYVAAGGLAVGALVAGLLDRGRTLPENVVFNQQVRDEFAASVQEARAENERRGRTYRATVTIMGEER